MLTTKNIIVDYTEVPVPWIFEYFCNLPEKLSGQDIKINSIFNKKDRTPSMSIFFSKTKNQYWFKDFSTGLGGNAVGLVMELKSYDFHQATDFIIKEYEKFLVTNKGSYISAGFKEHSKYKVSSYVKRSWNSDDQKFWTPFNIGTSILNEYFVAPLESYIMSKTEDDVLKEVVISSKYLYGYFTKDGELYKIYQPKVKDKKFIKVMDYIQGWEQLHNYDYLLITSSLKDIMSLKSMNLYIDLAAPESENSLISAEIMEQWQKQYKCILVLFDNDEAGIKAMKKYRDLYHTPAVLLTLAKDPSDALRDHGVQKVKERLIPLINNKIYEL